MTDLGIAAAIAASPQKPALIDGDRIVTFAELDERSNRLARALEQRGVGEGDRVALVLGNCVEFAESWVAIAKLGASMVPCNWHLKRNELEHILVDSSARAVVAQADLAEHWADAAEAANAAVLQVGGSGPDDYETAIAAAEDAPARSIDVLAAPVFYTSGTTGKPKGVVHGSFNADAARMMQQGQVALWGWSPDDVYVTSGPLYHAGPGGYLMAALFVGATTVILPTFDAHEWLRLVDRHRVTISFMVPAHFIRLLEVPDDEWAQFAHSSLRIIVHAGAPCPAPVKHRIIERLAPAPIWELYGMSEGGATRIGPDEWLQRPGSVGLAWPGVEVRVLDDAGHAQPVGEPGLVYVKPPGTVKFHYHDDADKTAGAWHDDAFTVGDIGYLDAEGYLYLTDRAADLVIRGGVNVYPREIEDVLFTHPAVVDCAVFGVPDERLGERLRAMVELRDNTDAAELERYCRAQLADFKVPSEFVVVDELPRLPNGKVLKRRLREEAWADTDRKIG
ncbi:MAG: AMP-binding protein [Acidimicrobiia bacterium]